MSHTHRQTSHSQSKAEMACSLSWFLLIFFPKRSAGYGCDSRQATPGSPCQAARSECSTIESYKCYDGLVSGLGLQMGRTYLPDVFHIPPSPGLGLGSCSASARSSCPPWGPGPRLRRLASPWGRGTKTGAPSVEMDRTLSLRFWSIRFLGNMCWAEEK